MAPGLDAVVVAVAVDVGVVVAPGAQSCGRAAGLQGQHRRAESRPQKRVEERGHGGVPVVAEKQIAARTVAVGRLG